MSSNTVLFPKDANMAMDTAMSGEPMDMTPEQKPTLFAAPSADNKATDTSAPINKSDSMKTLEYHRQVLQNKMEIEYATSPVPPPLPPVTTYLTSIVF